MKIGRSGKSLALSLGLALAIGCAHGKSEPPVASGPAANAETAQIDTTDELLDGPSWRYREFFDAFTEHVQHHWADANAARVLATERPGHAVSVVALRVVLMPNGRIRRADVERSSGSVGYDDLAVRVLGASQPFAAPGSELTRDGQLSFRFEVRFDARTGRATFHPSRP